VVGLADKDSLKKMLDKHVLTPAKG
jgi:hypothetical protein